jgi:hypothetical protein
MIIKLNGKRILGTPFDMEIAGTAYNPAMNYKN